MELYAHDFNLHSIPKSGRQISIFSPDLQRRSLRISVAGIRIRALGPPSSVVAAPEQPGGKMVVELVGAFNELTERMKTIALSTSSSHMLFKSLKLSIPILQTLPLAPDGRPPLSRALSVAVILADLQMDAEVISAGILREVLEAGAISIHEVRNQIGTGTAHLLHESLRLKDIPSKVEVLDDESASALRKFCLTYYDVRAVILDLVLKLDMMRHLDYLPRYKQQMFSLEVMKIHAPLAHAVGTNFISLELEDLSFRYLFPDSYLYVDTWLRSHETGNKPLTDVYKEELLQSLKSDPLLVDMVDDISVKGRYKSRYSTMKKLLRDGRKPEEVNDILGLRVILKPASGVNELEVGERACYRAREIVLSLWKEIPNRSKDYIAHPKANGYKSLHMAVDVSDSGKTRPQMEIQIRTTEMDTLAAGGTASHSLYKGGLTDPKEAKRLKAIMMAAVELAALRLKDLPTTNHKGIDVDNRDKVFCLLDKNGDGKISIEELMEIMEELGAQGEDAREMMQLLDSNSDGSLSSDEFDLFQKQVELMRNLDDRDDQYKTKLNEKLQMADGSGLIQEHRTRGASNSLLQMAAPNNSDMGSDSKPQVIYRCKKCRRIVASEEHLVPHDRGDGQKCFRWRKRSSDPREMDNYPPECSSIFVEPMKWMEAVQEGCVGDKLQCMGCKARLGSFNWAGMQCNCGAWVNPAFQLHKSRIDECNI